MKKTMGDFSRHNQMGGLLDQGLAIIGEALETDQATKDKAVTTISNTIKEGVMANKEMIIFGLFIFGLSMAVTNGVITYGLLATTSPKR